MNWSKDNSHTQSVSAATNKLAKTHETVRTMVTREEQKLETFKQVRAEAKEANRQIVEAQRRSVTVREESQSAAKKADFLWYGIAGLGLVILLLLYFTSGGSSAEESPRNYVRI